MRKNIAEFIERNKAEILVFWETLVNMESASTDKEGVDRTARFLEEHLRKLGAETRIVEFEKGGDGLIAVFGKDRPGKPVAFMGHFDTVFPEGAATARPFRIEDGKAYGPGVLDMKGGVVVLSSVARFLEESGFSDRPVVVALAGDEETAHRYSSMGKVFSDEVRGCAAAFNFETGDRNSGLVVGRKGTAVFTLSVEGVSVHAGREPRKGRNAILEIAHKVIAIQALNENDEGITYNVGTIEGGVVPNAVPERAEIVVDVRYLSSSQLDVVSARMQKIADTTYLDGTKTTLSRTVGIPPMEKTPENERLFEFVRRKALELGQPEPWAEFSGGGSDSAFSVSAGVPTLDQMGVRGEWNHSEREYALVDSLFERIALVAECVMDLERFAPHSE